MKKLIAALITAGLVAGAAGTAQARSIHYVGKASGGEKITLTRTGNRVSHIRTGVPAICLPTTYGYSKDTGVEYFAPPGSFRLGVETKRTAQHRSAMWHGKITHYYRVTVRRSGRRLTGRLKVAFMYGLPIYDSTLGARMITYYCQGAATFTARPR
jgi:hypothetical protein